MASLEKTLNRVEIDVEKKIRDKATGLQRIGIDRFRERSRYVL